MSKDGFTSMGGVRTSFPTTCWSDVLGAGDKNSPEYLDNLSYLFSAYWKPVYKCIRVSWNADSEEAKDLTQEFFLSLLTRQSLDDVSPEKGRFRHFVKAALKNFLLNYKRDKGRIKRGARAKIIAFDFDVGDADLPRGYSATPDEVFHSQWARTVLDTAIGRLKQRLAQEKKEKYFEAFELCHLNREPTPPTYEEVAKKLDVSRFDVGNYLKSVRGMLRQVIMEVIRESVADDASAEEEFKDLMKGLAYGY